MSEDQKPPFVRANPRDAMPVPSPQEIAAFEERTELELPDSFKRTIARKNGGVFYGEAKCGDSFFVDILLSLNSRSRASDLEFNWNLVHSSGIVDALPVAAGPGSDFAYLRLSGTRSGEVFIRDRNGAEQTLSDSYEEFLASIYYTMADCEPDQYTDEACRAVDTDDLDLLRHRIRDGVAFDLRDKRGLSLLMQAALKCRIELMSCLLQSGASIDSTDSDGETALFSAVYAHSPEAIRFLVHRGSDVNHQNAQGYTALMKAAFLDSDKSVRALLDLGADPSIRGNDNCEAKDLCDDDEIRDLISSSRKQKNALPGSGPEWNLRPPR